ncbi:MAG: hypothetical protein LBI28_14640 [Treponema sp.]|jgi:ribonuclease HII|nr:hypothetical protein [Treponema sp.]
MPMHIALELESYHLFQNKPASDSKKLSPLQRQEIADKISESIIKIVNLY